MIQFSMYDCTNWAKVQQPMAKARLCFKQSGKSLKKERAVFTYDGLRKGKT